ncbi:MAG: hypothetical protein AB8H03_07395 [Saprospiraceae bacterium]
MNKLIIKLLILLFISMTFQAIAQDKKGIALGNSDNPAGLRNGDLASYESAALTGVQSTSLCTTVERAEWKKLLKERGIQETEDFLNGEIIPQGVSLGAEYLLLLSFQGNNVSQKNVTVKGKISQKIEMALTIGAKLVSVETGEVKHSKVINLKESSTVAQGTGTYTSKGDASSTFKSKMLKNLEQEFSDFIYEVFPPAVTILSAGMESKRGKAKLVLCRTNAKFRDGTRFNVYTEETIDLGDGQVEVIENKVGELKMTTNKSTQIIACKVVKGKSEIYKLNEDKVTLKCKPNFKTGMFDGFDNILKN